MPPLCGQVALASTATKIGLIAQPCTVAYAAAMIDDAVNAALQRLDLAIDTIDAAANLSLRVAPSDDVLRSEVRAVIAELDAMLGRNNG